jgi:hypothetical protein
MGPAASLAKGAELVGTLTRWLSRTPVRVFLGLLGLWLVLYFHWEPPNRDDAHGDGTYHGILDRGDGHYMYLETLSLVFDRDLDLSNQYRLAGDPFGLAARRTVTGRAWIYPIGTAILQIPFFLAAEGMAATADLFGAHIPLHGYSLFHQRVTFFGALLAGFLSLVVGYRLARRHVSQTAALYGAVVIGFGTAILFFSVYWVSYAHAWTALAVALLVDYWDATRGRHDARRWAMLGLLVGLAALTRMQEAVFAAVPASEAIRELAGRLRRGAWRDAARLCASCALATAIALLVVSPQLVANQVIMGSAFAVHAGENYMRWSAPFLWETLFSTRNGLFVWTPLAYASVLGLLLAPRGNRAIAAALGAGFLLTTWVNGSGWAWWSDFSFSNRRFVDVTVVLIVGFAFVVERLRALHARWPRFAPHAALLLALAPFLILNLDLTWAVGRGYQKNGMSTTATSIYEGSAHRVLAALGNPMSAPASWIWAARHGVPVTRYDQLVGGERLFVASEQYRKPGVRVSDTIKLDASAVALYGAGGLTMMPSGGVVARDGARLVVPLFLGEDVTLTLHSSGDATVEHDALHPGTNDLVLRCPTDTCAVEALEFTYEPHL